MNYLRQAHLLVGNFADCNKKLIDLLPRDSRVWRERHATFKISNSRFLRERQSRRSDQDVLCLIVAFDTITIESQNALLKIFEEPNQGVNFFLIAPETVVLLPTLLSRLVVVRVPPSLILQGSSNRANRFLDAAPEQRLIAIESWLKKRKNLPGVVMKQFVLKFLQELESTMLLRIKASKSSSKYLINFFETLIKARSYLRSQAGLSRLVLEHLALVC